jgi:hypothetical protein
LVTTYPDTKRKYFKWLFLAYCCAVGIRYLIAILASQNPFIMPDEALYANIARSLIAGDAISLRNQPLTYTNILYSLLISPIYSIFEAGTQFRMIQLFNCIVMNLAVFPAYGIANNLTKNQKVAFGIALLALLLPDMLLTTRIMTEAIVYPLFLWVVYLMFSKFSTTKSNLGKAFLAGLLAFLLTNAKSGSIALVGIFFIILIIDFMRSRSRSSLDHALVFAITYAALYVLTRFVLSSQGMDFAVQSIYQTQTQLPTLTHLKQTLPGLLLYAFFIPIAFGIYPLLLPASNLCRYDDVEKKQAALTLITLALYAIGACYLFFDTETIGNFFQGRIHIRYVFMFLPLLLGFVFSPKLEGVKPNSKLIAFSGFLLAMMMSVSFDALLSGRQYPVDAISLSYIIHDDSVLNWRLLSQIAAITFAVGILALIAYKGWNKQVKRIFTICLVLGLVTANWLGYDLNEYNNSEALSSDAQQCALQLSDQTTLIVPDSDTYFDNTLSVLDIAMTDAPYFIKYDDLCTSIGDYGTVIPQLPPKYWTEDPINEIPVPDKVVFSYTVFSKMVLADDAQVQFSDNGYYGIVSLDENQRLFHSALAGLSSSGEPQSNTVLYIYDETLLSQSSIRVYFQTSCSSDATLSLSCGDMQFTYELDEDSNWIYGDFAVLEGATVLKIAVQTMSGEPIITTYMLKHL